MSFPPYILIAVTYERYLAIAKPFDAKLIGNRRNASKWILLILFCLNLLNLPQALYSKAWYQIMFDNDEIHFTVHKSCQSTSLTGAWLDSIFRCALPFTILLIFNILIMCLRREHYNNRCKILATAKKEKEEHEVKVLTFLLLAASLSYLFFALPYISYILLMPAVRTISDGEFINAVTSEYCKEFDLDCRYIDYKVVDDKGEDHGKYSAAMYLWYIISLVFMYINNSINFYLYCLGGTTFRNELMGCKKSET